jgi:hypothetical protein
MRRRQALQALGAIGGASLAGGFFLLPPAPSRSLGAPDDLAIRLFDSLSDDGKRRATVEYDHPLRQYHNRGIWGGGLWVSPLELDRAQRCLVADLFHAGLSEVGRQRVPNEYFTEWPGVYSLRLLFCGSPKSPPYTLVLTGPHLNLRLGGTSREGTAFGGPLVYGDQRGDSVPGLADNLYRFQLEIGQRLFASLDSEERNLALQERSPIQTAIQLQGREGTFAGVRLESLSRQSRAIARELTEAMLSTYPDDHVAYAWRCLEQAGGLEAMSLAYFRDSDPGGDGRCQNFRLEGPSAVFYFRGHPHLHAFIHVAMNADEPLGVGEIVATSPRGLEGARVKRLFEAAMQAEYGTDLAFYDVEAVAGTLRAGPIRTGDVYTVESWQDRVVTAEIHGSRIGPSLIDDMRARGLALDPRRTYSVATTAAALDERRLGQDDGRRRGGLLRDATIAYLRQHGVGEIV